MTYTGSSRRPPTAMQVERARRQEYQERQQADAAYRTAQVNEWVAMLESILDRGLTRSARIDLSRRRRRAQVPPLDLGPCASPAPAPQWAAFAPAEPGWLGKKLGGDRRYADQLAAAQDRFAAAQQAHTKAEADRQTRVQRLRREHDDRVRRAEAEASAATRRSMSGSTACRRCPPTRR